MRTFRHASMAVSVIAAFIFLSSCSRDTPDPTDPAATRTFTPGEGFFILNEGGFGAGNSSVSYYALAGADAGNTFNNLFSQVNGTPLGDVGQSMTMINNRLYVVVNNSSKIEVLNPLNMNAVATITGLAGPRNILQVNAATAFITQMYSEQVAILDLASNTVTGYINLGIGSEALVLEQGKLFITSQESDKLYVLDAPQFSSIDSSIVIAPGGNSMVVDGNGKLWILAYGYWATSAPGGLFRVNPASPSLEASMPFTTFDFPTHLVANPAGDSLFFLNFSIYRMSVNDATLPAVGYISGVGHAFYTIGFMPNTSNTFVGDAVDYVQSGLIFRYDAAGTQTDVDTVGIIPNNFLMY
ncbi:MAG TPA: DUF5074 domain-containing protein [Bacteroidia bacterium]|nr:DUF5074 domain-containing protein [Bacteroidia bacterium]